MAEPESRKALVTISVTFKVDVEDPGEYGAPEVGTVVADRVEQAWREAAILEAVVLPYGDAYTMDHTVEWED